MTERFHKTVHFDVAFQIKILCTLFQEPEFTVLSGVYLNPESFDRRVLRWFAKEILTFAKEYQVGITLEVLEHSIHKALKFKELYEKDLPEIKLYLHKLSIPVVDRYYVKDQIFKFVEFTHMKNMVLNAATYLERGDTDSIRKEIAKVLEIETGVHGGLGHFYTRDIEKRTERRKSYIKNGVPTGLTLDNYLKPGGIPPGDVLMVGASTGRGKSQILVNIAREAVLHGFKVLYVSVEMSEESIEDRLDASFTGIEIGNLEDRAESIAERLKCLRDDESETGYNELLVIKEFPSKTLTPSMLRAYIRSLQHVAFYPDLVIVDYPGEMILDNPSKDHLLNQADMIRYMKKMAKELRLSMAIAGQVQREALEQEVINLDDIKGAYEQLFICDVVVFFCQTKKEKERREGRIFVGKNRLGLDCFDFPVFADWSRSLLRMRS